MGIATAGPRSSISPSRIRIVPRSIRWPGAGTMVAPTRAWTRPGSPPGLRVGWESSPGARPVTVSATRTRPPSQVLVRSTLVMGPPLGGGDPTGSLRPKKEGGRSANPVPVPVALAPVRRLGVAQANPRKGRRGPAEAAEIVSRIGERSREARSGIAWAGRRRGIGGAPPDDGLRAGPDFATASRARAPCPVRTTSRPRSRFQQLAGPTPIRQSGTPTAHSPPQAVEPRRPERGSRGSCRRSPPARRPCGGGSRKRRSWRSARRSGGGSRGRRGSGGPR